MCCSISFRYYIAISSLTIIANISWWYYITPSVYYLEFHFDFMEDIKGSQIISHACLQYVGDLATFPKLYLEQFVPFFMALEYLML